MQVPGGVNMTSLLTIKKSDVSGKSVKCHNSVTTKIGEVNDLIELLANGIDDPSQGVVLVNNGTDKNGNFLLRVAQAQRPEKFEEGAQRLKRGLDMIYAAPAPSA